MHDRDLHFHDLRGTAATRFAIANLPLRVIAEIMGWEEEHVDKILRRYVGRTAAPRRSSPSSIRPEGEHSLQNRLQNHPPEQGLSSWSG
jgi:hypothetical protein